MELSGCRLCHEREQLDSRVWLTASEKIVGAGANEIPLVSAHRLCLPRIKVTAPTKNKIACRLVLPFLASFLNSDPVMLSTPSR